MKKDRKRLFIFLFLVALLIFFLPAIAFGEVDYQKILGKVDNLMRFTEGDFSAVMTMVSQDPEKGTEKKVVRQFRRDRENKFLLLIEEPEVQKGQGYLKVDDNLWFYDPESRKFSHTSLKENFSNTDAKNSDFGRSSLSEDYTVEKGSEERLGKYSVYVLELKASNNEVTYPYRKLWVTKRNYLVLKMEDYSLTKRLLRASYFPKYAKVGNTYTPTVMLFVDKLVKGKKTQITVKDISIEKLPDYVFTKAYVERVNR